MLSGHWFLINLFKRLDAKKWIWTSEPDANVQVSGLWLKSLVTPLKHGSFTTKSIFMNHKDSVDLRL